MTQKPLTIVLLLLLFSCSNSNFEYIKLKDYKYTKGTLKPLSEIQLLSVSGGKPCTKTEVYFYQFVGIDKATKDTIRVLSPCQLYDESKAQSTGIFMPIDDSPDGINKFINADGKNDTIDEDHFFVVINKKHFTETRDYKTVIGGIGFKD